jgi:hypothetical protein
MRANKTKAKNCGNCGHARVMEGSSGQYRCAHPEAPEKETISLHDCCDDWKPYSVPQKQKMKLPWEYCECGCKGWNLDVGGVYFWMYWDLHEHWYVSKQHGFHQAKVYESAPAAEAVVRDALGEALYARTAERAAIKLVLEESNG